MSKPYVVTGTLRKGRVVELDVTVPLEDSKVRVSLEPLAAAAGRSYMVVLAEIRRRQAQRGHVAPTREEVDRFLTADRESWGA